MNYEDCPHCQQRMGFKRHVGIGSFIGILITFGWWLLVLPFYPVRCIRCGFNKRMSSWQIAGVCCVVLFPILAVIALRSNSTTPPQAASAPIVDGPRSQAATVREASNVSQPEEGIKEDIQIAQTPDIPSDLPVGDPSDPNQIVLLDAAGNPRSMRLSNGTWSPVQKVSLESGSRDAYISTVEDQDISNRLIGTRNWMTEPHFALMVLLAFPRDERHFMQQADFFDMPTHTATAVGKKLIDARGRLISSSNEYRQTVSIDLRYPGADEEAADIAVSILRPMERAQRWALEDLKDQPEF